MVDDIWSHSGMVILMTVVAGLATVITVMMLTSVNVVVCMV